MPSRGRTKPIASNLNATARSVCRVRYPAMIVLAGSLAACTPQIAHHGHVFTETDLQQVQPGMSKDQVRLAFGTPDTTTAIGGGAYYYIASKQKSIGFTKPKVVDRKIVAVYFDEKESVTRIANYGLKDGKVFDFVKRKTPSHGQSDGLVNQLFRNLGQRPLAAGGY